jgi:hypothetical protein
MKYDIFLTVLIMLLVCSGISFANTYCPQEACSNIFWDDTYIGVGSSSFTPAYTTATAWSACTLENSIFTSVGADLNNDGWNEYILTPSVTKLSVYNTYCALVGTITSNNSIVSPPVINDYNFDGNFEIIILTNSTLDTYNGTSLALLKSYSYLASMGGQLENMGCDDYYCFAKNATANSTAIIRLLCDYSVCYTDFNITVYSKILPQKGAAGTDMPANNALAVYTDKANSRSRSGAWCYVGTNANMLTCSRQESTGTIFSYTLGSASFVITSTDRIVSFFAKAGTSIDFFLTTFYTKAGGAESDSEVYDVNNNILLNTSAAVCGSASCSKGNGIYSNWMIGQFDKTSDTQACLVTEFNRTLCYANGYYGDLSYNYTMDPYPVNSSALIFMGDWNVSEPYMGFATSEAIYYAEPTGKNYSVIRTGFKNYYATSSARTSPVISMLNVRTSSVIPVFHFVGTPTILYVDSSVSKMLKQGVSGSCGNGVCDAGELFSCPSDCSLITPTYPVTCVADAQCPDAFPKCFQSRCVAGYTDLPCSVSNDCPPNASICYNNICVASISGGYNNTQAVVPGSVSPEQDMDSIWRIIFGGSQLWRMVIGLLAMIFVIGRLNDSVNPTHNPLMMTMIIAVGLILFTSTQILPGWLVVLLIIITGCLWFISILYGKNSHGQ